MTKNCLDSLISFLLCRNIDVENTNIIDNNYLDQEIIECSICLEEKELELGCLFCPFKCCQKCKYDWYNNKKTCPICRQNNVL